MIFKMTGKKVGMSSDDKPIEESLQHMVFHNSTTLSTLGKNCKYNN